MKKINLQALLIAVGYTAQQWKSQKTRLLKAVGFGDEATGVYEVTPEVAEKILHKLATGKSKFNAKAFELKSSYANIEGIFSEYVESEAPQSAKSLKKSELLEILQEIAECKEIGEVAEILSRNGLI